MGSSKKHKEKDRERDKRDKDRKDRERRYRDKERDGREKDKKDRKRRLDDDDLLDYAMEESSRDERGGYEASSPASRSEGTHSLTIEETNKIRAKLGLKPLQVDTGAPTRTKENDDRVASKATDGEGETISIEATNKIREKLGLKPLKVETDNDSSSAGKIGGEDIHVPAINISEQESTRKFKERIAEMREKRKIQKKLSKLQTLGSSGEDDASSWVMKSRKITKDKHLAEQRAKLLEEMDEEFGIGDLVEEEFGGIKKKDYSSSDLRGLKVQHSSKLIEEGQKVILTLKDSSVLDDDEDTLTNVNLVDLEKAKKNIDLRKKKPDYNPYDDEFDEDGQFVGKKSLLSKYDEEDEDENAFILDSTGSSDFKEKRKLQQIKEKLKKQAQSLEMPALTLAKEFYTQEEMVQFKKPKKKRKIRKRTSLKADELEKISSEVTERSQFDHGSRSLKSILKHTSSRVKTEEEELDEMEDGMDIDFISPDDDGEILGPDRTDTAPLVEDDEAELELQVALERSRRLKMKHDFGDSADKVAAVLSNVIKQESEGNDKSSAAIVLDSTSEFCRALGDIPTYGGAGNRAEEAEEMGDFHMEIEDESEEMPHGGWERVKNELKQSKPSEVVEQEKEDITSVLSDEPVVSSGVGAALQLATKKGLLEGINRKVGEKFVANLPATKAVIDEEKMRDEERDRLRRERDSRLRDRPDRDRDRDEFNKGFNFDVKLEYVDDHGRDLTPKEAFRFLSHKFHGKTSGKMKTEKRAKKQLEEMKLKKMSTTDTPLNTVALLTKKQKVAHSPYLILSGGGKALSTTSLTKGK